MTASSSQPTSAAEELAGERVAVFASTQGDEDAREGRVAVGPRPGSASVGAALLVTVARLLAVKARVVVVAVDAGATIEDLAERAHLTVVRTRAAVTCRYGVAVAGELPGGVEDVSAALVAYGERLRVAATFARRVEAGEVALVGSGPGRAELVTLGALAAVSSADVIVTDRLVAWTLLAAARDDALVVDVAKVPRGRATRQEDINAHLIDHAQAGRRVVRLKGGDPFVFGRGMEEYLDCVAAGVPVRVVSGISSSIAVPAASGVPVTHRGVSQSFTVVSGHVPPGDSRSTVDWSAVGRVGGTVVVLMGVKNAPLIAHALLSAGKPTDTPVVAVQDQALGAAQRWDCTLDECARGMLADKGCEPPAVLVVGDVAAVLPQGA